MVRGWWHVKRTKNVRKLEEKMEQLKARKQQIESRLKEKERKERTHRLIQIGAIFEKYFDIADVDQAENSFCFKDLLKIIRDRYLEILI